MEYIKYQKVRTERLMIKDGIFRSVHIRENGRARWVIKYDDKLICVTGVRDGDKFIADEKYSHVIKSYKPKRISRKPNGTVKSVKTSTKSESADCIYNGEKRRIQFSSREKGTGRITGRINYRGKVIKVRVDENMIAVKREG